MPKSASLKAVTSPPPETQNTSRPTSSRRVFDTMENLFFKEGDELCKLVPVDKDDEEITELVPRPRSRRRIVIGIAVAAMALVGLAALIF